MRRRQICNMHGGYRGSGVTINWNTTPSQFVPIISPTPPTPPTPPIPINPEPLPQQPNKKGSNIIGIVGLTLSGVGLAALSGIGAYTIYKNKSLESGIIGEEEFDDPLILSERPDQGDLERKEQEDENLEFDINNLEEE